MGVYVYVGVGVGVGGCGLRVWWVGGVKMEVGRGGSKCVFIFKKTKFFLEKYASRNPILHI